MSFASTCPSLFKPVEHMLQGLCFWMGYKMEVFPRGGTVPEALCVDKAIELLSVHLDHSNYRLDCEVPYSRIDPTQKTRDRADVAVYDRKAGAYVCIIEFKRARDMNGCINKDLAKMSRLKSHLLCLEILLFEQGHIKRFNKLEASLLTEQGNAKRKTQIAYNNYLYYVRVVRSAKALSSPKSLTCKRALCIELV